jgi:hypothetical protein
MNKLFLDMPSPTHTCFGLTHHQDSAQRYMRPLHAPSRSPLHQLHTTGQHYGNHATTLCKCSSALYSASCTWLHLITFKRPSRACHLVHPPALLLFDVTVRAVLWPWTLPRSTNHLLFNCISCLPTLDCAGVDKGVV